MGLTLSDYQERAMITCLPESENFSYMLTNLVGEVGEFCSKVAKSIRKDEAMLHWNKLLVHDKDKDKMLELRKEAGDILWQLSGLCSVMGWSLEDVAMENLTKLAERKKNGTIAGSGDGVTKEERGC